MHSVAHVSVGSVLWLGRKGENEIMLREYMNKGEKADSTDFEWTAVNL